MSDRFAQIAINIPLDRTFDYEIPPDLLGRVRPGVIVRVPFGPRTVLGYCVGTTPEPGFPRTKPVLAVVEAEPVFGGHDLALARWIAAEYAAGIGEVLDTMLPAVVRKGRAKPVVEFARLAVRADEMQQRLSALAGARKKQQAIADALVAAGGEGRTADVLASAGASRASLKSLVESGLVVLENREVNPWEAAARIAPPQQVVLTRPQQDALAEVLEAVANRRFQPFLLLGVTGSGKTEVYLRTIERVIAAGRQAIVLVPEIVLTPQTVSRFVSRFRRVAVMHSNLSGGERHAHWRTIERGEADVIIGARSAVFAPARSLGIIVIDEEHENTFKQDNSPRYHAREVALHRGKLGAFPVVMGSATPSVESFYRACAGEFRLLELPERVEKRPLPEVGVINMAEERMARKGRHVLSRSLEKLVAEALARKEQVMLFLNRRGFTTHLFCPRCGFVLVCPHCSISLIYHKDGNAAVCHYCGHRADAPERCPECRGEAIVQLGMGTEKIEEEIRAMHVSARVERVDGDTMSKRGAHDELYRRIHAGEVDILVGTQMLAKGHDFPDVTLVGVIDADTALHFPDFRARERTFQLLTQVAGRTGRSEKGGRVVVQTFSPQDPSVLFAAKHDYIGFARRELDDRKALGYPPFSRLIRVLVEGEEGKDVLEKSREVAAVVAALPKDGGGDVMGPVPAPIARIKGRYRFHLLVKLPPRAQTSGVLAALRAAAGRRGSVSVSIDVDPVNML